MITPVLVPQLTITMEEGTLIRWLKQEGEKVKKDDALFEVETDKALAEVTSPASGILRKIVIREGTVPVGSTVAFIGDPSDAIPEIPPLPPLGPEVPTPEVQTIPDEARGAGSGTVRATPAARRRAKELGLDISRVRGTGPGGRIMQEDLERAAIPLPGDRDLRAVIGRRVTNAWRTVPHIHIGAQLRAVGLKLAFEKAKRTIQADVTITDLLLLATASLLPKFRALNTVWHEGRPEVQPQVHLAFAVQTDRGVVAPVIRDADRHTLAEIATERKCLMQAAQNKRLRLSKVEGGTFTVTNLGMYPVDFFVPIINYPQSAILATGRVQDQVEFRKREFSPVPRLWVNLAVDHRVADGAIAAQFLRELEQVFESLEQRI